MKSRNPIVARRYFKFNVVTNRSGRGYLIAAICSFKIGDIEIENAEVKIDTGAETTLIPLAGRIGLDESIMDIKYRDIKNGVPSSVSHGIETDPRSLRYPKTDEEKLKCKHLVFKKEHTKIRVSGLELNDQAVYVSYDRSGTILLGMDVLKDWDIHIGKSVISDRIVFLGCPRDRINPQYLEALEKEFKLGTTINSNRIYRGLNVSS